MFYCEKCGIESVYFNDYYIRRGVYVCRPCSEKIKIMTRMNGDLKKHGLTIELLKRHPSVKKQYIENKKMIYELKKAKQPS